MQQFKQFVKEMYGKGKLPAIKKHHEDEQGKHLKDHRTSRGYAQKDTPSKSSHMATHHTQQVVRARILSDPKFSHKKQGYDTRYHRTMAKNAKAAADRYQ